MTAQSNTHLGHKEVSKAESECRGGEEEITHHVGPVQAVGGKRGRWVGATTGWGGREGGNEASARIIHAALLLTPGVAGRPSESCRRRNRRVEMQHITYAERQMSWQAGVEQLEWQVQRKDGRHVGGGETTKRHPLTAS